MYCAFVGVMHVLGDDSFLGHLRLSSLMTDSFRTALSHAMDMVGLRLMTS